MSLDVKLHNIALNSDAGLLCPFCFPCHPQLFHIGKGHHCPAPVSLNVMCNRGMKSAWVIISVFLVSGCCHFVPCHGGTEIVGYVVDIEGNNIEGAIVTLYGSSTTTNATGCFYIRKADALPFELSAEAEGFKMARSETKWGKYQINIVLAPEKSGYSSEIRWGKKKNAIQNCT